MNIKKHLMAILALIMTTIALLGIFVACDGLPASNDVNVTEKHYSWEDPPDIPTLQTPDPLPEYDADIVEPEYTMRYAASSESDKYHRPSCHYVDQILSCNLIYFYSESSARCAGYSPCSVCSP